MKKVIKALMFIGEDKKLVPENIISVKHKKEYILKKGERFIEVIITICNQ